MAVICSAPMVTRCEPGTGKMLLEKSLGLALKDWLKNDPHSQSVVSDIEVMIDHSESLQLCADLANGSKHLTLKTTRTGDLTTKFGPKKPAWPMQICASTRLW